MVAFGAWLVVGFYSVARCVDGHLAVEVRTFWVHFCFGAKRFILICYGSDGLLLNWLERGESEFGTADAAAFLLGAVGVALKGEWGDLWFDGRWQRIFCFV